MRPDDASIEDEAPPSAADSLDLIRTQKAAVARSLIPDPRLIYLPWGLAWLIGFGLLFLRHGPHEEVRWNMPAWLPLATLYALMIVAFVVSGFVGAKANRQVRGESATRGKYYGLAWFAAFAGVAVVANHFSDLLPPAEVGLLWASLSVSAVAVLYLAGAAVWHAREMFILGAWLMASNIAGVVAGPGWHSLIISLAGGGGMIIAGMFEWRVQRRRP